MGWEKDVIIAKSFSQELTKTSAVPNIPYWGHIPGKSAISASLGSSNENAGLFYRSLFVYVPPKNGEMALLSGIWAQYGMGTLVWRKCDPTNYAIIGTHTLVYLSNIVCTHKTSSDQGT